MRSTVSAGAPACTVRLRTCRAAAGCLHSESLSDSSTRRRRGVRVAVQTGSGESSAAPPGLCVALLSVDPLLLRPTGYPLLPPTRPDGAGPVPPLLVNVAACAAENWAGSPAGCC